MIPFTQYLLPDGRKVSNGIDMDPDTERLAKAFIDAGGYYEAELLSTGDVSLTACFDQSNGDNDIAIEVVPNGPGVAEAVEKLVRSAVHWLEERA